MAGHLRGPGRKILEKLAKRVLKKKSFILHIFQKILKPLIFRAFGRKDKCLGKLYEQFANF